MESLENSEDEGEGEDGEISEQSGIRIPRRQVSILFSILIPRYQVLFIFLNHGKKTK